MLLKSRGYLQLPHVRCQTPAAGRNPQQHIPTSCDCLWFQFHITGFTRQERISPVAQFAYDIMAAVLHAVHVTQAGSLLSLNVFALSLLQ